MLTWLTARLPWPARRLGAGRPLVGRVEAIFIADAAGTPMRASAQVLAIVDRGLADDRYAVGRGYWRLTDGCQVTLVLAEALARAERRHGLALGAGQHRRNLVVSGLMGVELRECCLQIGMARLHWQRPRPPCGYLDRVAGRGLAKALGRHGGHCLRVHTGGLIQVGDPVRVLSGRNAA
ncbi:MAG: MOSC domain-containing protein [Chromatiaceae bacterium]|nr:MAG: MOSC domain-containing protein [Chromatiaceae bacterium]